MHIRCPHCHHAVEVIGDQDISQVTCPSCGSAFELLQETTSFFLSKRSIGHFELLDQLGTGGYGTVWKARDTKLDRLVAIKVPRFDHSDPQHGELFLREARAAAQLRHPHVVAVHEVGRQDGTLYIVSDFVQGVTLADRLTLGPYPPREAAELLVTVAQALHHAHESGVIHRDLKPHNIMLDAARQPHIMDFGLAKREAGEITMTVDGKIVGTAAYMSPEQARGEAHHVDRRTDIYSLGVILFELLTGERPFRGNRAMLLNQVLHDEPPGPRKLNGRVPRDLETICLKCLQKSPDRRFRTASEMAADLQRWLDGKPILARPVSRIERLTRWMRRQPLAAALIATVVVVTVLGFAGVTWQWRKTVAANVVAKKNLEERDKQQVRRELNFGRAIEAVDKMLTHVGEQSFLSQSPELEHVRKAILEDALKLYEGLVDEKADDADVRRETARAAMRVGAIRELLNERDAALAAFGQAIDILDRLIAENAENADDVFSLAGCHYRTGMLLHQLGRLSEAADSHNKALVLIRPHTDRTGDFGTLGKGTLFPSNPLAFMCSVNFDCGEVLFAAKRPAEAVAALREAIRCAELARKTDAGKRWAEVNLPNLYKNLATYLDTTQGNEEEVERVRRLGIEVREMYVQSHGAVAMIGGDAPLPVAVLNTNPVTAGGWLAGEYQALAGLLRRTGRESEAKEYQQKAVQVRAKSIEGLKSSLTQRIQDSVRWVNTLALAKAYSSQARLLMQQGRNSEANDQFRNSLDLYVQLAKQFPSEELYQRAVIEVSSARLSLLTDEPQEWKVTYSHIKDVHRRMTEVGISDADANRIDDALFQSLREVVRAQDASRMTRAISFEFREFIAREACRVAERLAARDAKGVQAQTALGWSQQNLGGLLWIHSSPSRPREAVPYYQQAVQTHEQIIANYGRTAPRAQDLAWSYMNLAGALMATDLMSDALAPSVQALELRENRLTSVPKNEIFAANVYASYERTARVIAHLPGADESTLHKIVDLARARTASDPERGFVWRALGTALYRLGNYGEAADALRKAVELKLPEPELDQVFLAMSLTKSGQHEEAKAELNQSLAWIAKNRPNHKLFQSLAKEATQLVQPK